MTSNKTKLDLPGNLTSQQFIEQTIRVNHAGEYGARRIYAGQMAVLKADECIDTLKHMAEQEEQHFNYFDQQLIDRRIRPTALAPLWHVAGYVLGAGTAMLGKKAAMACTVAVEEAIDEHYKEQLELLDDSEQELKDKIEIFRQEELEHRDIGLEHHAEDAACYPVLANGIKMASKMAIWLSKRL